MLLAVAGNVANPLVVRCIVETLGHDLSGHVEVAGAGVPIRALRV